MLIQTILIISLATLIGFVYLRKVRNYDIYEKEPITKLLFVAIIGGLISVITSLILYQFVTVKYNFINAIFKVGIIEELSKLLALVAVYRFIKKDFNEIVDGIIYITAVSLGFSVIENIFYAFKAEYPFAVLSLRSVTSIIGHISFSGYMGIAYYIHKKVHKNYLGLIFALFLSSLAHGFYDGFLFHKGLMVFFIFIFIALIIFQLWFLRTALGFSNFREELSSINFIETDNTISQYCCKCEKDIDSKKIVFRNIEGCICNTCNNLVLNHKNIVHLFRFFRPILKGKHFLRKRILNKKRVITYDPERLILYDTKTRTLSAPLSELSIWLNTNNQLDESKVLAKPITGFIIKNIGLKYITKQDINTTQD